MYEQTLDYVKSLVPHEYSSWKLYRDASVAMRAKGLNNVACFLHEHSKHELEHAAKLERFIAGFGKACYVSVPDPYQEVSVEGIDESSKLYDVLTAGLEKEQRLMDVYTEAVKQVWENDYIEALHLMNHFIAEQEEEISLIKEAVSFMDRCGGAEDAEATTEDHFESFLKRVGYV